MKKSDNKPKSRPILFNGDMVRAIVAGNKTMTRRVIKPQPDEDGLTRTADTLTPWYDTSENEYVCPYGKPGKNIWVRENFCPTVTDWCASCEPEPCHCPTANAPLYRADMVNPSKGWKPSIFMPKNISRITLKIKNVRVERLQSISPEDAILEGIETNGSQGRPFFKEYEVKGPATLWTTRPVFSFQTLWDSINGKGDYSWESDPWVWVVEFEPIFKNILEIESNE